MLIYWVLFAYFAAGASIERPEPRRSDPALWFGGLLIALLIGLRYQVGADWRPYVDMWQLAGRISFSQAATLSDPGYFVLNWVVQSLGGDLWIVNLVCGSIFAFGVIRFARTQERPWLTVLVAVPYLIIVVAMGYTRQSVAIGIILAGLASYFKHRSLLKLAAYFLVASLFHKTAVIAFPLICIGSGRGVFLSALFASAITYAMYAYFLSSSVDRLVSNYIGLAYAAQGAAIRVAMSVLPAILFFLNRQNLGFSDVQRSVWRNFAVAAFAALALLFVLPSSAVVDRIALYVIPLQLAVLSRAWKGRLTDGLGVAAIIAYSALILFAWLNFAIHARFWVPYQFWQF